MTHEQLIFFKLLFSFASLFILLIIGPDVETIIRFIHEKNRLANYVQFEKESLRSEKKEIADIVHTAIWFDERDRFAIVKNAQLNEYEEVREALNDIYPGFAQDLSIGFLNSEINRYQANLDSANEESIKDFYKEIVTIQYLDFMWQMMNREPCNFGFKYFELFQPITEDSIYVGIIYEGGIRNKLAFQINGKWYPNTYDNLYTIEKTDTIHLTTLNMVNCGNYIDTARISQAIAKTADQWRRID